MRPEGKVTLDDLEVLAEPVELGVALLPLLVLLLLQAARAVMPATARARTPMRFLPDMVIAPPSSR